MTTAPKLPEGLEPVAYGFFGPWEDRNKLDWKPRNKLWEPLVRLSDAQAALQAQAAEKDAEIAALKGLEATINDSLIVADAERYRWLRDPERGDARGRAPYVGIENDDDYPNRWALFGSEADAAIDSALLAAKEAK